MQHSDTQKHQNTFLLFFRKLQFILCENLSSSLKKQAKCSTFAMIKISHKSTVLKDNSTVEFITNFKSSGFEKHNYFKLGKTYEMYSD